MRFRPPPRKPRSKRAKDNSPLQCRHKSYTSHVQISKHYQKQAQQVWADLLGFPKTGAALPSTVKAPGIMGGCAARQPGRRGSERARARAYKRGGLLELPALGADALLRVAAWHGAEGGEPHPCAKGFPVLPGFPGQPTPQDMPKLMTTASPERHLLAERMSRPKVAEQLLDARPEKLHPRRSRRALRSCPTNSVPDVPHATTIGQTSPKIGQVGPYV